MNASYKAVGDDLICRQIITTIDCGLSGTIEHVIAKFAKNVREANWWLENEGSITDFYADTPRVAWGHATRKVKFDKVEIEYDSHYEEHSDAGTYYRLKIVGERKVDKDSDEYRAYFEQQKKQEQQRYEYAKANYERLKAQFEAKSKS